MGKTKSLPSQNLQTSKENKFTSICIEIISAKYYKVKEQMTYLLEE
jgi:hypothetical protein